MPQTHFLYQEDLLWSLKAAQLGEDTTADTTLWVRSVQYVGRAISRQLPSVFVRSRAVLGMQTALAMLRNERKAVNVQAYVPSRPMAPSRTHTGRLAREAWCL